MSVKEAEIRELLMAEMQPAQPETEAENDSSSPDEPVETLEAEDGVQETDETPETEEDEEIVTIASLAADLEIDAGQLYGMKIPVDGYDPLTIGELKDIAQAKIEKAEADETIKQEMAERQAELERREAEIAAQAENVAPQELVKAEAELARAYSEFAAIDWPQLEATNPGEAALKRQKLMEQYQIATYNRDQITQRMEATRSEIQAQRNQAIQQQTAVAIQQLQSLVPEWRDEKVYLREREHMVNSLVDSGVNEAAIRGLSDPTIVKYLRDSWLRDQKIAEAAPNVKPPTSLKASAVRQGGRGKAQAEKRLFEQAAKSKDRRVKDKAISQLLFGSR